MHIDSMHSPRVPASSIPCTRRLPPRAAGKRRGSRPPLLTALLVLLLLAFPPWASTSTSPRLSLSIQQLSASAPGLSASITCLLPLTAPATYSCSGFASHLTQVLLMLSTQLHLAALPASAPIQIEAHFIPFCEEAVDALDRDPARPAGHRRCTSAMSHAGALAFASSVRYWKLQHAQKQGQLVFVPSCAVKNLAATGKLSLGKEVGALDVNYDADILMQVRSDWHNWYFGGAPGSPTPMGDHLMDIRITLQHELTHGLGMALAGVDTNLAPGLALPWHYPSQGKWAGWTDASPWYFTHLVDRNTGTPLSALADRVHQWNDKSVAVDKVGEALRKAAPDAYAAAKALYELNTTPGAIAFRPSPLLSTQVEGDIVVDSASANASVNSLVHLDTATYKSTVDDIILIPDTAAYAGRKWNATLGAHLGAILGTLGFPNDPKVRERMAGQWIVTHAVPVHLRGERIDVMGWKWNWVKHGPWAWVNVAAVLVGGGAWGWMAWRDWQHVKRVREWTSLPGGG